MSTACRHHLTNAQHLIDVRRDIHYHLATNRTKWFVKHYPLVNSNGHLMNDSINLIYFEQGYTRYQYGEQYFISIHLCGSLRIFHHYRECFISLFTDIVDKPMKRNRSREWHYRYSDRSSKHSIGHGNRIRYRNNICDNAGKNKLMMISEYHYRTINQWNGVFQSPDFFQIQHDIGQCELYNHLMSNQISKDSENRRKCESGRGKPISLRI